MLKFNKFLESLDEAKIVIKRRYTENHPERNVRGGAQIRNSIIEALRDKKLTLSEFNEIVGKHSKNAYKWTQRNKRFFTIKEENVTLSRYGNKIAKTLQPVNEKNHDKKSVLKALGKNDDAIILYRGQEYIIYNPDNGNDENTEMWGDKTVFALDQDGDEIEVAYKDIERINASHQINLNEGVHPKIKKAMKAVEKGETVYGENIRFPGRFKIVRFTMGGAMAVIDYEDGTKPYEMAAMNIAVDKMKFESVVEKKSLNESIQVEGKRTAKKVVTQLNRIFTKQLPDLQQMGKTGIYGCVKYFLDYAMTDANFHREKPAVVKTIKKAHILGIEVKLPGLGGYHAKIYPKRIEEILHQYAGQISNAAGWSGQGIVEGCALYLSQFHKDDATATAMINAFNAQFEGEAVRVDVTKKTKAVNEGIDFENIFEAEIKDDESFIDYVKTVYAEAFGEDYDEDRAIKAAEGMLKKSDGDYGAAVGMCKASMG